MNNSILTSNALPGSAWRRLHWLNTALLAFALATPLLAEGPQNKDEDKKGEEHGHSHIVRPDSRPFGYTYGEWATKWWQWALSIPADGHHPLQDETGADAARKQSGPVWFLGGVINVSGKAVRHVTVPADKALFFPVANVECSTVEPPPWHGNNEAELRACAEGFGTGTMACTIDGLPVENLKDFESTSPLFDFSLPANNILGVAGGGPGQAVDRGTYLMVKSLSPGEHTIAFTATSADGGFTLDITYQLTVVRPARVYPPDGQAFGTTYSKLAMAWWDWAFNQPPDKNPVVDTTGAFASVGQDQDFGQGKNIFFLAGNFGGAAQTVRHCTIPKGKALFFPIVNSLWITPEECATEECRQISNGEVDQVTSLECKIDGLPVADLFAYRAQSPPGGSPFHIQSGGLVESLAPAFYVARGYLPGSMADGYWLLVKLDDKKDHVIEFSAARGVPTTVFQLSVKYILTVGKDKDDKK